jgi:hypothetical protein
MKLLARILSHGFAIAVVLLLAIGLIYRGKLFPEYDLRGFLDIGKLAEHQQEESSTPGQATGEDRGQVTLPSTITEGTPETEAGDQSAGVVTPADEPAPAPVEPEVIPQEPTGIEPETPPVVMTEAAAESPEEDSAGAYVSPVPGESGTTAAAESAASGTQPEDMSESTDAAATLPESAAVTPPQAAEASAPADSTPQEKAYQLLADAREAYWLRDYDIAESKYKDLTRVDPDNPDGYGELGNMYFSQGQWEQAATAYYEAGIRLVGQGLLDQAEELVAVIRGLNGEHADDLERKIKEARSAAD